MRLLLSLSVILVCWFLTSVGVGVAFAALGPGAGALVLALMWGASGAAYSCLWEFFERRVSIRYSGILIAIITGLAGLALFDDASESRWNVVAGLFAVFLIPSYLVFYLVQSIKRRCVLTNAA